MKLTPAQKANIEQNRAANLSRRSSRITLTPEQREDLLAAQAEESGRQGEHTAFIHQLDALLNENSFLGSIRRALNESPRSWDELSQESGVSADRIEDFFCGNAELTLIETDRLIASLGLHLVPIAD